MRFDNFPTLSLSTFLHKLRDTTSVPSYLYVSHSVRRLTIYSSRFLSLYLTPVPLDSFTWIYMMILIVSTRTGLPRSLIPKWPDEDSWDRKKRNKTKPKSDSSESLDNIFRIISYRKEWEKSVDPSFLTGIKEETPLWTINLKWREVLSSNK